MNSNTTSPPLPVSTPARTTPPRLLRQTGLFELPKPLEEQQGWSLFISLSAGICGLTSLATLLVFFKFQLVPPKLLPPIEVVSSPAPLNEVEPETVDSSFATPPFLPRPPINVTLPPPPPPAVPPSFQPMLSVETNNLTAQAAESLERLEELARIEAAEREQKRLEEEQRKVELAQQQAEKPRKQEVAAQAAAEHKALETASRREQAQKRKEQAKVQAAARKKQQAANDALARQKAEQNRQAALARKLISKPSLSRKTTPNYPISSRRAGHQGTTLISATISEQGRVTSPQITSSSGYPSLDSSALKAVRKWRFKPAKNALGLAMAHTVTIPVTFDLN